MKKPILVNDARELMQEILRLDARIKADTERKKVAMEELAILMQEKGVAYDGKREKSAFVYATIQEDKKIKYTIFRETLNKGAIDWKKYAMEIGGTEEDAEPFRRPPHLVRAVRYASTSDLEKIGVKVEEEA